MKPPITDDPHPLRIASILNLPGISRMDHSHQRTVVERSQGPAVLGLLSHGQGNFRGRDHSRKAGIAKWWKMKPPEYVSPEDVSLAV